MKIELRVAEGVVHSKLQVADHLTRTLLESHLTELRGMLADQGLEIGSFQVTVHDGGAGGQQQFAPGDASHGSDSGRGRGAGDPEEEALEQRERTHKQSEPGRIDFLA